MTMTESQAMNDKIPSEPHRRSAAFPAPTTRYRFLLLAGCLAAGLAASPARADERLLLLLRDKGVISQDEYGSLRGHQDAALALAELLAGKGVLSAAELERLRELPPPAQPAARVKLTVAQEGEGGVEGEGLKFELGGRLHADYRNFDVPVNNADDTFEVRRARFGVTVTYDRYFEAEITGDFSESGAKLDTGYANFGWWQAAQLRAGKFKMPFSLEEATSSNYIDFQERSLVNAQAPGKLTGMMLHGAPYKGVYYGVALSNGAPDVDEDNNDAKDLIGRAAVNAAELLGYRQTVLHLGLGATRGELVAGGRAPNQRTEGRGLRLFRAKTFSGGDVDHERRGLEVALAHGPVKLQGEFVRTGFEGASAAGLAFEREIHASYASLSWLLSGESYADAYKKGAFSRIKPHAKFVPGKGGGAWELGLRHSRFDATDFKTANPAGTGVLETGFTNKASATTLGLKWIPNEHTRFLLNWVRTSFATPVAVGTRSVDSENALTLRAQVNF